MSLRLSRVCIFVIALPFAAQAQNAPAKSSPATPTPTPLPVMLKKLVCFMRVEYQDGTQTRVINGTAFFVHVEEPRLGVNRAFFYLLSVA
jgi:hypothetical protein